MSQTQTTNHVEQDKEPGCICTSLRKVTRAITQLYDDAFRPLGCRITQVAILDATELLEPVTLTRLAERTMTDRTTLTRNVQVLQERGWLEIRSGDDKREHQICITDAGRALLKQVSPRWKEVQGLLAERFGKAELNHLLDELKRLSDAVKEEV